MWSYLATIQTLKPKNAQENCTLDVLDVHVMYALCMYISCLFSFGMNLRVRKFRDLIDFGLHCSLRVLLVLLYFIPIENLHIKAGILLFLMLNLHFTVIYKVFQSALAFLIFQEIIFLLFEHCLSQSSSKWHFEQTWAFSIT